MSNSTGLAALRNQANAAAAVLGAEDPEFADFPDNRMDTVALLDVVQRVEAFFEDVQPSLILTHHKGDLNVDHKIVAQAVHTAARSLPGRKPVRLYAGEVGDWPHPRSLKAVERLARVRGCEVGLEAAEALCSIRAVYA